MDKRSKSMIVVTVVLACILMLKSNLMDPVGPLEGELELYRQYALQTAPLGSKILKNTGLLTYRVVKVNKTSMEGSTEILIRSEGEEEWVRQTLEGEYTGKVRSYLLNFIPVKDINFKGGVTKDGK